MDFFFNWKVQSDGKVSLCGLPLNPYYWESHCKGVKHKESVAHFEFKSNKFDNNKEKSYIKTGIEYFGLRKKKKTKNLIQRQGEMTKQNLMKTVTR